MKRRIILIILALTMSLGLSAQSFTLGTNILGYLNFATINAELSYTFAKKWSLHLQTKVNPFTFNNNKENQMQNRQASVSFGARLWPWHTNSGWFVGSSLEGGYYNIGGIVDAETKQGYKYGLNMYFGYTIMLAKHLNLELGAGFITAYTNYTTYSCPKCGREVSKDKKIIVSANNILAQLVYIF